MRVLVANAIAVEGAMHVPYRDTFRPVCGQPDAKDAPSRTNGWYEKDSENLPNHWFCYNCLVRLERALAQLEPERNPLVTDGGPRSESDLEIVETRREECHDHGADETVIVEEEFTHDREQVDRETRLTLAEDGSITIDQRMQGLSDIVTLSEEVLDIIAEERR